jgi:hypothetical protein
MLLETVNVWYVHTTYCGEGLKERNFIPKMWRQAIVTYRSNTRQRFGKDIPAGAKARDNVTSISRQQRGKHASSKIQAVFSAWSVQSSYKNFSGVKSSRVSSQEVKSRVSRRQPAGIWAGVQRNWIESSVRNWQLQNNGKKGIRLCKEDSMCDLNLQWDSYKSVARIRLMKTEKPSECVTVN